MPKVKIKPSANKLLAEARILAGHKGPYLRSGLMAMVPIERPGLGTCAMDMHGRLYFDAAFLVARDLRHRAYVMLHEYIHWHQKHAKRQMLCCGNDPEKLGVWRLVVDAVTNEICTSIMGWTPDEAVTCEKIGIPRNGTVEQGFVILWKKKCEEKERQKQAEEEAERQRQQEKEQSQGQEDPEDGQETGQDGDSGASRDEDDQDSQDGQDASDGDSGADSEESPEDSQDDEPSDDGKPDDSGEAGEDGQEQDTQDGGNEDESQDGKGQGQGEEEGQGSGDQEDGQEGAGDGQGGLDGDGDQGGDGASGGSSGSDPGDGEDAGEDDPFGGFDPRDGGSASDGIPRPWELGEPSDEEPGLSDAEQDLIEAQVAREIESYDRGRGTVPGALAKQAKQLLHPPVSIRRELAAMVRFAIDSIPGFGDITFSRPSNRQVPGGCILPSNVRPLPRLAILIDSSGSMMDTDTATAIEVVGDVIKNLPDPQGVLVYSGDACLHTAQRAFRKEVVAPVGGGGTEMGELIVEIANKRPSPKLIIVITDGETSWCREEDVKANVLVCLTRRSRWYSPPPDWMTTVQMKPEE